MRPLEPYAFDLQREAWQPMARPARALKAFSVATYNVWFDLLGQQKRWPALLDELQQRNPDIVAFQEVTAPFLRLLLDTPWIRQEYFVSDRDGTTYQGYGVVVLTRLPPSRLTLHDLPSRMKRKLLVSHFADSLAVATVHLESLRPSATYRDQQFAQIMTILDAHDHAVLMGDMNFCSSWAAENQRVPASYTDVWARLCPADPGYTVDSQVNRMIYDSSRPYHKRVRYDRIFVRSKHQRWQPVHIELLGNRHISGEPLLFPSDHFGLYARFAAAADDD